MRILIAGYAVLFLLLSACSCNSCRRKTQNEDVLSQRYIHKYGYLVSKEEWEARNYPGQVVTSLSDGVTVTATYENGVLHGPMTYTFPHSQNVEVYHLYNWGDRVKEVTYNTTGMPIQEKIMLSPLRYSVTAWYSTGSPMCVEEFSKDELVDGQYYTMSNEIEARVEKGRGLRIYRDCNGMLLSKETIEAGYATRKETFYPSGTPESLAYYHRGKINGERKTFAPGGEPLSVEQWVDGQLHGTASYFKNATKYLEISYSSGEKNGLERHYIDGETVSQEIAWEADMKHGPSTFYYNGKPEEQQWFYGGKLVSKRKFDELHELDNHIMQR
jgi:antitoxin component YwqK of YwqJK toxin-antitoxin module